MKKLLLFIALFMGSNALAQYTTTSNWVTRYLDSGGDIKNITGLVKPKGWERNARWDNMSSFKSTLPAHFDWNDYYQLQPIKNQASCGSCWAFSVTAVIESLYWIKNAGKDNKWFDLAEQTLVSSCEQGGSCSGGYFNAFDYVQEKGLPHESADPYRAQNSSCKSGLHAVQKAVEWRYIGGDNSSPTIDQMKSAILQYGPISVDVNGGFGSYGSGIFTGCGSTSSNHMVVLDGWTDDPAYAANGGGYWHMRNSWGADWGEKGYMRIVYKSRGGSKCNGIGGVAAYAILDGLEPQKQ